MKKTLLLVDDEPFVINSLRRALADEPYEILTAGSGQEGLALFAEHRVGVVVSDEKMPGMGGAEFLAAVRERYPETIRIMLTGHASIDATMRAVNQGEIYRFFTKPWDDLELRFALRSAFDRLVLEEDNRRLLRTVKRQSQELSALEQKYPGITDVEKDADGALVLPEISVEDINNFIERCNREYQKT
ncbi:response regulator receiver protein [Geobacter metallireducens RCH3]|uniref:Response regulator n=1 Tax=Geobacter metallireducens (strain ATCC 53774 / DSM 7210 / GS-15) TaxID=269799 RepID=Q39PZ4_GEOMG|nr:response regulator [Geobacter metallireducens]ABB33680.1 response regulator [Geobacter metallireducens GS-15]EHP85376.1 response regulator receiver protein [Geobacter metallireducens RCH3]